MTELGHGSNLIIAKNGTKRALAWEKESNGIDLIDQPPPIKLMPLLGQLHCKKLPFIHCLSSKCFKWKDKLMPQIHCKWQKCCLSSRLEPHSCTKWTSCLRSTAILLLIHEQAGSSFNFHKNQDFNGLICTKFVVVYAFVFIVKFVMRIN